MWDWNAEADARTAFKLSNGNLSRFADQWGQSTTKYVQHFIQSDPKDAATGLFPDRAGILTGGLFGFWTFGTANIKSEYVVLMGGVPQWGHEDVPLNTEVSPNLVTKELIDGKTDRAKEAEREWILRVRTRHYQSQDISWRHLQFLIEMTSKYDPGVSPTSDVIEITSAGKVGWLHKSACGGFDR